MNPSALSKEQALIPAPPPELSIKLIGLGGVGSIMARYASVFLASLESDVRFVLIDGDEFEFSNATRMIFGDYGNKARVIKDELLPRFEDSNLSLLTVEDFVTPDNVGQLIHTGDIVLLAVDNHATRKLVNDHCATLEAVALFSGGNDGVGPDSSGKVRRGTFGNVQAYVREDGSEATSPLTHYHPEIESPADKLPTDVSCTELIATVPQILFANLAVASSMLNAMWLYLCGALHYGELAFDIADGVMNPVTALSSVVGTGSFTESERPGCHVR